MIRTPAIKPGFQAEIIPDQGVFLFSEYNEAWLRGKACEGIFSLINGRRSVQSIVEELQIHIPPTEVHYTLIKLEQDGYIVECDEEMPRHLAAFCHSISKTDTAALVEKRTVSVQTLMDLQSNLLASALDYMGIKTGSCQEAGDNGGLNVVITDDYLHPALADINSDMISRGLPWMLVKPAGRSIWIGPILHPEETACWECLAHRLRLHRSLQEMVEENAGKQIIVSGAAHLPSSLNMAIHWTATEIVKWMLEGKSHKLSGAIVSFDIETLNTESHKLLKLPHCNVCGAQDFSTEVSTPPVLQSQKKTFTTDGGHRVERPETTFEKYRHHISSITGVVKPLVRIHDVPGNLYLYAAPHVGRKLRLGSMHPLKNLRQVSMGKGANEIQSKTSCLCEALERYSGKYQGYEPHLQTSFAALNGQAIHPNTCMHFSEAQFNEREVWNKNNGSPFQMVPEPFDEEAIIDWSPIWSLADHTKRYLPTAYCYYGYTKDGFYIAQDSKNQSPFCFADSNGNAAGNTLEEAILQGFFEVVERDCVSMWWYNRVQRPAIDLDSFNNEYIHTIQIGLQKINRTCWALDLTADLGIPTFIAISRRTDQQPEEIIFGFGAHLDPTIALLRAFSELVQLLPLVSRPQNDGVHNKPQYGLDDPVALDWWKKATIVDQPYLAPAKEQPRRKRSDFPNASTGDLLEDITLCVNRARDSGMDVFVLDQTRKDIGLPTVKVIVPEMRVFWKRLGPGRLYDIPVKSGWLDKPTPEQLLNPIPFFL